MDNERTAEQKLKDRYKYQNDYIKNKYDRMALALPKGYKKIMETAAKNRGCKSISDYIKNLIDNDIQQKPAAAGSDFFPDYKPTKTKLYEIPAEGAGCDDIQQAETQKETDAAPAENGLDTLLAEISKNHGLL